MVVTGGMIFTLEVMVDQVAEAAVVKVLGLQQVEPELPVKVLMVEEAQIMVVLVMVVVAVVLVE